MDSSAWEEVSRRSRRQKKQESADVQGYQSAAGASGSVPISAKAKGKMPSRDGSSLEHDFQPSQYKQSNPGVSDFTRLDSNPAMQLQEPEHVGPDISRKSYVAPENLIPDIGNLALAGPPSP